MLPLNFAAVRSVLCLGAHSDDIEIGCCGTLLALLSQQRELEVHWIVFSGDETRAAEARASAAELLAGPVIARVTIHQFQDSYFPYIGAEIKDCFARLATETKPDLIFTHRRADMHQDHRLVAELTWNTFRNHLILEYEIPKYDGDLATPNCYIPLDELVAQRKIDHLLRHFRSQQNKQWFTADTFHSLMRLRGIECNSQSGVAEGFDCRKLLMGI
jgi:LmbE family N-acetylglucosaminyl deacetylase